MTTYNEAVEQTITAGEQIHQIVNGTATTEVTVEDGSKVPSIRKSLLDNFYFKDPIAWQAGQTEKVFNQLRQFTDGSWWYAPSATASNPISMGSTPVGDPLWKIYSFDAIGKLEPRIDEALRRSYAEAGYNLVGGSFEAGGTLVNANDALLHEASGRAFSGPAGTVAAGTNPAGGGFVDVSGEFLRLRWIAGLVSTVGTVYTYTSSDGVPIELYDPVGGHILGATPDANFHAVSDIVDVSALDGDLIKAIQVAKGKDVIVNSTVTVASSMPSVSHRVLLKGSGRVNFNTASFLSAFAGDFLVSGVHLHSDATCTVVSYATDAHVGLFSLINRARITGGVKFLYNASRTLNPYTTPHGIDVIWIENIDTDSTLETVMNFDNAPYKLANVDKNRVHNFSKVFLSLANTNSHPHLAELQRAQELCIFDGNIVKNDDNWWTTDASTIVTYGAVLLHEGNTLRYHNNVIEGIKARRQAGDPGKSHSTAYWLYMGALNNFVGGNRIKNCFSFGSRDVPNVAFKQKQGTNIQAYDNKVTFDGDWLTRFGESISATNDLHVIHDVEPGWLFEDVSYSDNLIELVANTQTIFCNASKYYFCDSVIRRGPTNLAAINIGFPVISYDNTMLTTKPVAKYTDNTVTNEGGSVIAPYIRSIRSIPFADRPLIVVQDNEYLCASMSGFSRVQGNESYVLSCDDNSATVTSYGSIFSDQGNNALAASVSWAGNSIKSIPASLTTQKGFGLVPYSDQIDVSLNVSSEGSIGDFILLRGAVVAPTIKYCVSGVVKTSTGPKQFSFLFTVSNQAPGVNAVSFIDADGATARTVVSNYSTGYFCKQEVAGTTTRLNIAGSASSNLISLSISESIEGVVTDASVNYDVNVYGVKQ